MKAFPLVLVLGILLFQIILLDKCPSKNVYDFQTIKIICIKKDWFTVDYFPDMWFCINENTH